LIRPVHPEDTTKVIGEVAVKIPEELHQDSIHNGSPDRRHGFNPWNRKHKAEIGEFL
jgi:hypothetical protein